MLTAFRVLQSFRQFTVFNAFVTPERVLVRLLSLISVDNFSNVGALEVIHFAVTSAVTDDVILRRNLLVTLAARDTRHGSPLPAHHH